MKKFVSFLLALVLTLSLTPHALAAVIVPASDVTEAAAGQTVKLTVTASQDEPLTGVVCLNYRVYFDEEAVELDAAACTAGAEGVRLTEKKTAADGRTYYAVSLLDPTSEGLTVTGSLYTLAFRVKDSALAGSETAFTVEKAHVYAIGDGAMQPVDNGAVDSGTVTVKITSGIPANVTMTAAKAEEKGITVTWEAAANAVTYTVYRKPAGTNNWAIIARNVDGTGYTDATVKAGESYTYTVRGVAADGRTMSKGYDRTGVTARAYSASAVPADVTMTAAKANIGSITVTWEAAEGAKTYTVYRKAAGTNSWAIIARNVTGTSYTDTPAAVGSYTYTVRGVAPDGRTMSKGYDRTGVTAAMTAAVATPADVTMTAAKAATGSITVMWEAAENAKTYVVYRKPAGTNNWAIIARNVTGTSYTDSTVSAGESYTYTARGVASDGKTMSRSYDHDGVTASVPASRVPADVTMVSAKADSAGILVTWKAASAAQTYTVYRKLAGTNNWTIVARSVTGTAWKDISAAKGTPYTYTVRGVAVDGRTMSKGYDRTGVTDTVTKASAMPADVTMTAAKAGGAGITVTWEYALDARTYTVYRKVAGTNSWAIIARNVAGTSYTDKTASAGESYTYTVRGVAADGKTMSRSYDRTGVTAAMPK